MPVMNFKRAAMRTGDRSYLRGYIEGRMKEQDAEK